MLIGRKKINHKDIKLAANEQLKLCNSLLKSIKELSPILDKYDDSLDDNIQNAEIIMDINNLEDKYSIIYSNSQILRVGRAIRGECNLAIQKCDKCLNEINSGEDGYSLAVNLMLDLWFISDEMIDIISDYKDNLKYQEEYASIYR